MKCIEKNASKNKNYIGCKAYKGNKNSRYFPYGGPLGYYLAHPELSDERLKLFLADSALHRALTRFYNQINIIIPECHYGRGGRPSLDDEEKKKIIDTYNKFGTIKETHEKTKHSKPTISKILDEEGIRKKPRRSKRRRRD